LVTTNTLKLGEKGTIIILYAADHAGSLKAGGSVLVKSKGLAIGAITLKSTTYQGKPALTGPVRFTSKKRVGTLLATVTVTLGSVRTDHTFKLGLK
jgi:hypothetical protein